MTLVDKTRKDGGRFRLFVDFHSWTVGIDFRFRKSMEDPLGQYSAVILCFGPLIAAARWPRKGY